MVLDLTQTFDPNQSYWECVLTTGRVLPENQVVYDFSRGCHRKLDWTLDLTSTGDLLKIKELWLVCPGGHKTTHRGNEVRPIMLQITEPGTAFQFRHATFNTLGGTGRQIEAHIIGKVTDKLTGDCICWIWDRQDGLIEYRSNINDFGMWRQNTGLMPLKKLSQEVMGLRLG